ncbi:hypothetical protein M5D96_013831, partial [Drosophila gunungcola]
SAGGETPKLATTVTSNELVRVSNSQEHTAGNGCEQKWAIKPENGEMLYLSGNT